jgi:[ribosomal protein S18]-alanine N-acetyltransferase
MQILRRYQNSDFSQLTQLFLLNTPNYFHPQEQQDLEEYLRTEIEDYFVIEEAGNIVASGGCNVEEDIGCLSWYIVHPSYQGKGLGKRLAKHCLDILQADPFINGIDVRTSQFVYPFYEKLGFKLISTEEDHWGPGFHLYHMRL